ncbi:hypothetical protein VCHC41A1_0322, partial [Vibrio cholerae HC-41A1]
MRPYNSIKSRVKKP